MKKWLFLVVVALSAMLSACQSSKVDTLYQEDGKTPLWVSSPFLGCLEHEICVVGSGTSFNQAKADAGAEMLRVFEINVNSTFKSIDRSNNNNEAIEEIEVFTKGKLSGSFLKDTFKANDSEFYVRAVLDRLEVMKNLALKMEELDNVMGSLMKGKEYLSTLEVLKLYNQRQGLNTYYAFLNKGESFPLKVTYEDILNKKAKASNDLTVKVNIKGAHKDKISLAVESLLNEAGIKVSDSNYDFEVKGELLITDDYLNVVGFIKKECFLELQSVDKNGNTIGSINITLSEIGRSKNQAESKAIIKINEEIKEKISYLGF